MNKRTEDVDEVSEVKGEEVDSPREMSIRRGRGGRLAEEEGME